MIQNYSFQVFWIPFFKKNFSEKYSEYFKINKSENFNSYKILLPGYPVKNILRIDPIDGVGEVVIKDLIISGNNQTFQFLTNKENYILEGIHLNKTNEGIRINSNVDDPNIILKLNSLFNFSTNYIPSFKSIFLFINDFQNIKLKGIFFLIIFCFIFLLQFNSTYNIKTNKFFTNIALHSILFLFFYRFVIYIHPLFDLKISLTSVGHVNYFDYSKFSDKFSLFFFSIYFSVVFLILKVRNLYVNN